MAAHHMRRSIFTHVVHIIGMCFGKKMASRSPGVVHYRKGPFSFLREKIHFVRYKRSMTEKISLDPTPISSRWLTFDYVYDFGMIGILFRWNQCSATLAQFYKYMFQLFPFSLSEQMAIGHYTTMEWEGQIHRYFCRHIWHRSDRNSIRHFFRIWKVIEMTILIFSYSETKLFALRQKKFSATLSIILHYFMFSSSIKFVWLKKSYATNKWVCADFSSTCKLNNKFDLHVETSHKLRQILNT